MPDVILIGFKHAGKSTLGKYAANELRIPFTDLDSVILEKHQIKSNETIRELMLRLGTSLFRELEHQALAEIITLPGILALGGGTPLSYKNQLLINNFKIIHITAPEDLVFKRIIDSGIPAFFPKEETPRHAFNKIWLERMPIYHSLAKTTLMNNQTISQGAKEIMRIIRS